jgi:hypothetical protein
MANVKGGEKLSRWLRELKVPEKSVMQAGFMAGGTYPDGTSIPLVAAVNEFGAPSRGQPPRPFFRNAIAKNKTIWPKTTKTLLKNHNYDVRGALVELGHVVEGDIKRSINELMSPPLKPATIARKGFSKPLIHTSTMLNSVTSKVLD